VQYDLMGPHRTREVRVTASSTDACSRWVQAVQAIARSTPILLALSSIVNLRPRPSACNFLVRPSSP
jgi:hypothetical protein